MFDVSVKIAAPQKFVRNAEQRLSRRERQVIFLLAQGATWKEVSGDLKISERTVRAYVENIRRKLGVPNTPAAVLTLSR